jgi:hypothetical protein
MVEVAAGGHEVEPIGAVEQVEQVGDDETSVVDAGACGAFGHQ